jgi:HNH endonuclease
MNGRSPRPVLERFEAFVVPEPNSGCHLWIGTRTGQGYGSLRVDGKMRRSHRIAWQMAHGPVPGGLQVLHQCDTPICVNVQHLFLGTIQKNVQDMIAKGRRRGRGRPLTLATVQAIREEQGTAPQRVVAQRFGISQSHISLIWSGNIWTSLPWPS